VNVARHADQSNMRALGPEGDARRAAARRDWLSAAAILAIGLSLRGWLAASLTLQKDE